MNSAGCRASLSLYEPLWNDITGIDGLLEVSVDWLAVPTPANESGSGSHRSSGAAKRHASAGRGSSSSSPVSFRQSEPYTRCLVTASTPEPEGGARCVSSARRDLCRGRGEILVPTATIAMHSPRRGHA